MCKGRTTTTTTTTTTEGNNVVIGDFTLKEFDNLLNMLSNSPEAIKQLNYTAFNQVNNTDSPLNDINLDNLAQE